MLLRRRLNLVLCLTAFPASALAVDSSDVLVLYNAASPDGQQVANYYSQVHPGVRTVGITGLTTSTSISATDYLNIVRPQVLSALTPATSDIVTTMGLPLRIDNVAQPQVPFGQLYTYTDPGGNSRQVLYWNQYSSLESELANVRTVSTWEMMGDQSYSLPGHFSNNPYYLSNASFSPSATGTLLTARLDGYTVSNVTAAIDRAQHAFVGPTGNPNGPYQFLVDNDPTKTYAPTMANLVTNVLTPAGMPVTYDNTTAFVGTAAKPVIGYDGHGTNQASTPANYTRTGALNITPADGAVFNSWESWNAASFVPPGQPGSYTGIQGQVGDWLAMGGTAAMGNVYEPYANISKVANEDQLFKMLLSGKTFGEAAWSSLREVGYVNTVVGDPLMTWHMLLGGDVNMDGVVDTADLSAMAAHWGQSVTAGSLAWSQGDLNGDGRVNIADLALLSNSWGQTSAWATTSSNASRMNAMQMLTFVRTAPTPEPGSLAMLAIGMGSLAVWRAAIVRRRRAIAGSR